MLIEMYTTFAQLELEKIRTRTKEALAVKKQKGEKLGRPRIEFPSNWKKVYKQYKNRDITGAQAMKLLDLKKTTFYKLVKEFEELFRFGVVSGSDLSLVRDDVSSRSMIKSLERL